MEWPIILAIVLAIPVILMPIALIWYLNVGGIIAVLDRRRRSAAGKWLFDFERKGTIAWERQDGEVQKQYLELVDSLINQIKKS